MKCAVSLFIFIATLPSAGFAQSPANTLDEIFAKIVAAQFPQFKLTRPGVPFHGTYPTTPVKLMIGDWKNGGSKSLSVTAFITETPEEVKRLLGQYLTREIMPRSSPISGLGENAILLSTCRFVNVAFSRANIFVTINYSFRGVCNGASPTEWNMIAPEKELERAATLGRGFYQSITTNRTMSPCRNDFLNTYFPRPTSDSERLLEAAFNGDTETVRSLSSAGVPISVTDRNGNTPLHLAVRHGCPNTIQALVEAKANLNARNNKGETPLMIAADLRVLDAVRKLIDAGADARIEDNLGSNAARRVKFARSIYTLFPQPEENAAEIQKLFEARGIAPSQLFNNRNRVDQPR